MISMMKRIIREAQYKNLSLLIKNERYLYFRKVYVKARRDLSA